MPRTRINSASKDVIKDNGSIIMSVIQGEQIHMDVTLNWLTNLSSYTLISKITEADMTGEKDENNYPVSQLVGAPVTTLSIIDTDPTDNSFIIVLPESLSSAWTTQPEPTTPSYGWLDLEVADDGVGDNKQVWKPIRGLVEVLYSPTEEV